MNLRHRIPKYTLKIWNSPKSRFKRQPGNKVPRNISKKVGRSKTKQYKLYSNSRILPLHCITNTLIVNLLTLSASTGFFQHRENSKIVVLVNSFTHNQFYIYI